MHNRAVMLLSATLLLAIAGCARTPSPAAVTTPPPGGGYYGGDRPPARLPVDPDQVADAVPRYEPPSKTGNKPYTALGKTYRPLASAVGFVQRGAASWYGAKFHGRRTSSGETYDMFAMTAAHPILPLPSFARVTHLENGKSVVVKINDRGPFLHGRIIDLSYTAAHKLGILHRGTGPVEVRVIPPGEHAADATERVASVAGEVSAAEFMVQVGAYTQPANADNLRQRLQRSGYTVAPPTGGEQAVHRIQVGPFVDIATAHTARRKLEAMLGHPVTIIVRP